MILLLNFIYIIVIDFICNFYNMYKIVTDNKWFCKENECTSASN